MRSSAIATLIALGVVTCSACAQRTDAAFVESSPFVESLYPDASYIASLYHDDYWRLTAVRAGGEAKCIVIARERITAGIPDHGLMIGVSSRGPRFSAEVLISLVGPPPEYRDPNEAITVAVNLGPSFTRRMEFYALSMEQISIVAANLTIRDLYAVVSTLQPSAGQKSVRFENGTTWRFPPPASPALSSRATECLRMMGVTQPSS